MFACSTFITDGGWDAVSDSEFNVLERRAAVAGCIPDNFFGETSPLGWWLPDGLIHMGATWAVLDSTSGSR